MIIEKEEDFGAFLAAEQKRLGLNNNQMAAKIGIKGSNLKQIITGQNSPTLRTMLSILKAIGATIDVS